MKIIPLAIPDVVVLEPPVYRDNRGFAFESFNGKAFEAAIGQSGGTKLSKQVIEDAINRAS